MATYPCAICKERRVVTFIEDGTNLRICVDCIVVLVHQISREVDTRRERRPNVSHHDAT